jgi:ABC-type transport system involved in multi-copper enzyme maturation permease subunit
MLPGPVFTFELMATARRSRFYLIRAFYAMVLLVILWSIHSAWASETGGNLESRAVKWFAFSAFCGIAAGQEILTLALTPVLVAGVIADEKQRKTLHYLMASQLSSSEIVLGKLLVRLLYMIVLLGVSMPVLSLLVLFGGIDPILVLLACGGTFTTAWFLAALSIWVSTIASRVRDAFFVAYGLEILWLCAPFILRGITVSGWPALSTLVSRLADWTGVGNPVELGRDLVFGVALGGGSVISVAEMIARMMVFQVVAGIVLAIAAAVQLRPIFRRQGGEGSVRVFGRLRHGLKRRGRWRILPRPLLGDHPMRWKELYTGGPRGFARIVGAVLFLIGGGFLVYHGSLLASSAIMEMWNEGFAIKQVDYLARIERWRFFSFLRFVSPLLYILGSLAVAGAAAASITSEHEEDTWVSLTGTDLTGREILFAKMRGALKRGLPFAEALIALAIAGTVANSIHVLSLPALFLSLAIYGWFAAALGVWISLCLRSTWRAQFLTISTLVLINVGGQGTLNTISRFGYAPQVWPGFTPYEISKVLFEPRIIDQLSLASWPSLLGIRAVDDGLGWLTVFSALSLIGYASLAAILTWHALRRFEVVAGRARRSRVTQPRETRIDFASDREALQACGTT